MSIDRDILTLEAVPFLRLMGTDALRVIAIGAEAQTLRRGAELFTAGDVADCGYVVREGSFRIANSDGPDIVAGPNTLIGELALIIDMARPGTATAIDDAVVIRISRSLFQKVLESFPDAAQRLRDDLAARTTRATGEITAIGARIAKLGDK